MQSLLHAFKEARHISIHYMGWVSYRRSVKIESVNVILLEWASCSLLMIQCLFWATGFCAIECCLWWYLHVKQARVQGLLFHLSSHNLDDKKVLSFLPVLLHFVGWIRYGGESVRCHIWRWNCKVQEGGLWSFIFTKQGEYSLYPDFKGLGHFGAKYLYFARWQANLLNFFSPSWEGICYYMAFWCFC